MKRYLILALIAAATACGGQGKQAPAVTPPGSVRAVRGESDRRRPGYRRVVEKRYPGIADRRIQAWPARGDRAPSGPGD